MSQGNVPTDQESHCCDCCCARSWKALGITEFTGKSIPEHIEHLRNLIGRLHDELRMVEYDCDPSKRVTDMLEEAEAAR